VCLNALLVTDAFGGQRHIVSVIAKHYYWGILKQLHTLVGSFDVIGEGCQHDRDDDASGEMEAHHKGVGYARIQ
jgi:hypothetical protein